jgi:hypothetical protein
MGCNCGKKKKYVVTTKEGRTETVDTLTSAMAIIRKEGGRYQPVKV